MTASKTAIADPDLTRAPARRGTGHHGNPILYGVLGVALFAFSLLIVTLQTQTNESYINGEPASKEAISAQWSIWLQIPKLMFGDNVPGDAITSNNIGGVIVGQTIELLYVITVTTRKTVARASQRLGKAIGTGTLVLIILNCVFDFYTDAVYGISSFETHIAFAVICTLIVGFGPTLSITLMEDAYKKA